MILQKRIPVVNLFAGAGGLAEGFSPLCGEQSLFRLAMAVEKDSDASQTLRLRQFCRQFKRLECIPNEYYSFVHGRISLDDLFQSYPAEAESAMLEVINAELGNQQSITDSQLDSRLEQITDSSDNWVLIGGPPCQAYSKVGRARFRGSPGYRSEKDPRFFLYLEYLKVLGRWRPAVFVFENVMGLLSARSGGELIFPRMVEEMARPDKALRHFGIEAYSAEYRLYAAESGSLALNDDLKRFVIHAETLGLPQTRHRLILIGVRADLEGIPSNELGKYPESTTGDVISDLPKLRSGISKGGDRADKWINILEQTINSHWLEATERFHGKEIAGVIRKAVSEARASRYTRGGNFVPVPAGKTKWKPSWFYDSRLNGTLNHFSKAHMPADLHRYLFAAAYTSVKGNSPMLRQFPEMLLPHHKNVKSGKFPDRFRCQPLNTQSKTVTSHLSQDGHYFIHPDPQQCRALTVREAARIQTFPDNYFFCGGLVSQYRQVGNAVPPLLSALIARQVQKILTAS